MGNDSPESLQGNQNEQNVLIIIRDGSERLHVQEHPSAADRSISSPLAAQSGRKSLEVTQKVSETMMSPGNGGLLLCTALYQVNKPEFPAGREDNERALLWSRAVAVKHPGVQNICASLRASFGTEHEARLGSEVLETCLRDRPETGSLLQARRSG